MATKTEEEGAEHATPTTGRMMAATAHSNARRDLKPWESEEAAERAAIELEMATARVAYAVAVEAAEEAAKKPSKAHHEANEAAAKAKSELKKGIEAVKHSAGMLEGAAKALDSLSELAAFQDQLAVATTHLADLTGKFSELTELEASAVAKDAAKTAAEHAYKRAEPVALAQRELDLRNADLVLAKAEAAGKRNLAEIRKKFVDRGEDY
jgi:hypothetical protein